MFFFLGGVMSSILQFMMPSIAKLFHIHILCFRAGLFWVFVFSFITYYVSYLFCSLFEYNLSSVLHVLFKTPIFYFLFYLIFNLWFSRYLCILFEYICINLYVKGWFILSMISSPAVVSLSVSLILTVIFLFCTTKKEGCTLLPTLQLLETALSLWPCKKSQDRQLGD